MKIIKNVRSSQKQEQVIRYGSEVHVLLGEREVAVETDIHYEYDEVVLNSDLSNIDVVAMAEKYYKDVMPKVLLPITDISVTNTRFKVGDVVEFPFTSELPDDSYFIPYRVVGDTRMYLKDAVVLNGSGIISFNFTTGGVYYIDANDLPLTDLKVNSSSTDRFTIYVAE